MYLQVVWISGRWSAVITGSEITNIEPTPSSLVAEAISKAGSTDKEKIRSAMQSLTYAGVMGAKGMKYDFPEGKRTGFDPNGMVVRVYEGDKQGRVIHVGQK